MEVWDTASGAWGVQACSSELPSFALDLGGCLRLRLALEGPANSREFQVSLHEQNA